MADTGKGPHVVHGPYDGLTRFDDASDVGQRKHSLIDPMQMDDVCLGEFGERQDICSGIGNIYFEKVVLLETVGFPDDDAFPNELPDFPPRFL